MILLGSNGGAWFGQASKQEIEEFLRDGVASCTNNDGSQCVHFLGGTNETIRVYNCGCASEQSNGVESTVCECELVGKCSLWAQGGKFSDESVVRCHTCTRFADKNFKPFKGMSVTK